MNPETIEQIKKSYMDCGHLNPAIKQNKALNSALWQLIGTLGNAISQASDIVDNLAPHAAPSLTKELASVRDSISDICLQAMDIKACLESY